MSTDNDIKRILKNAVKGLQFVSETEAPFTAFSWDFKGAMNAKEILKIGDYEYEEGTPVETMSLPDFFRAVPPEDKEKFARVAEILNERLGDIQVYKVGAAEKDVYIVGRTKEGRWAGLMTSVVET